MRTLLYLLCLSLCYAPVAQAAPRTSLDSSTKPDLSKAGVAAADQVFQELTGEARTIAINAIETYLTGISSVVADFTQSSSDGSTGTGKFFMKRPGKVRWQYNPPTELLLISNGKTLTYYDPSLKQVTYVGVDDTLASFVAQKTIRLDGPTTKLTRLEANNAGMLRATMIQKKKPDEGSLTLEFIEKPMKINRLITVDATGNETEVTLLNPQFGPVLDDKLFIFTDPRGINDRRNQRR